MKLKEQTALMGRMSLENNHVLENVKNFNISEVGKYKGIYLVKKPTKLVEAKYPQKILPLEITGVSAEQRIKIKPTKSLYFKR